MSARLDIGALALDLDGTALTDDKRVTPATRKALVACRARGIAIIVATARGEEEAARYLSELQPDAVISNAGARARYRDEDVYERLIPEDTAYRLTRMCLSEKTGAITTATRNGYLRNDTASVSVDYRFARAFDFSRPFGDAYKVTVSIDNEETARRIAEAFPELSCLCYTGETWHRFAQPDATKRHALTALCARMNVPLRRVAAFGDDMPDLDMLLCAGVGVAMGNAVHALKARADFITDTNERDGVAAFIREYILETE